MPTSPPCKEGSQYDRCSGDPNPQCVSRHVFGSSFKEVMHPSQGTGHRVLAITETPDEPETETPSVANRRSIVITCYYIVSIFCIWLVETRIYEG